MARRQNTKWRIITLDVWGNPEDGWEVNDRYSSGTVMLSANPTDAEIVAALKVKGFARRNLRLKELTFDGDDGMIFIDSASDGKPELQLERLDG